MQGEPNAAREAPHQHQTRHRAWVAAQEGALFLAPMEGVTDAPLREFLSSRGGFTHTVTEFLRINEHVPPAKVFYAHAPELKNQSQTSCGTPVIVQLLGGRADVLAASAQQAIALGAAGIDLNFGCPAPTVNRNDGGATLLRYPDRIREIVLAVRKAVPPTHSVSAKLRLGWDQIEDIHVNADRAAEGGASWITIHGRTRQAGYKPPIFWRPIGEVRKRLVAQGIPVIANGDIWTLDDFKRCRDETGSNHFMLGRGALADPHLVHLAAKELGIPFQQTASFGTDPVAWALLLEAFIQHSQPSSEDAGYILARAKQWVRMAALRFDIPWFHTVKRAQTLDEFISIFSSLRKAEAHPS